MLSAQRRVFVWFVFTIAISSCAPKKPAAPVQPEPITLSIAIQPDEKLIARYELREPVNALYYERELDGYRAETWTPLNPVFQWEKNGEGERLERRDGRSFDQIELVIPIDYRALPESYAPFSPFSRGGTLIHSGQFHVCLASPCESPVPLPMTISAKGLTIGVEGDRRVEQANFTSRDSGTNIFVGTLRPVDADGFIAIIDPGLPGETRTHLERSLPQAINFYSAFYGALSFIPELYVSIDARREPRGRISTQGGVLPGQIFMHFDGEDAEQRVGDGSPLWLDWFFAHEAAHLYQQDKAGLRAFDMTSAWIHEGGADAMAGLSLFQRGSEERRYVGERSQQALQACEIGLNETALSMATADGEFDLHYHCGLLIWLALDQQLHDSGIGTLHDLNRVFFERVRNGQIWDENVLLDSARDLGVAHTSVSDIRGLSADNARDRLASLRRLNSTAERALERHSLSN